MRRPRLRSLWPILLVGLLIAIPTGSVLVVYGPSLFHPRPNAGGPQPLILSSALPYVFANRTFVYTLVANTPVNWTCLLCPGGAVLTSGTPSPNAGLHGTPSYTPTSLAFSVKVVGTGGVAWQNWTSTVLATAVVTSTPSFYDAPGVNYTYLPVLANPGTGGTWTFSGAPWVHFVAATGAVYGSNPTNATFQNVLTYTSSTGSWRQAWYTAPFFAFSGDNLPKTIAQSGTIGNHVINATLPTTDVWGIGSNAIWLGEYPIFNWSASATKGNWTASFDGGWNYTIVPVSSQNEVPTLYGYWANGTSFSFGVDTIPTAAIVMPLSGFTSGIGPLPPTPAKPINLRVTGVGVTNISLGWGYSSIQVTNYTVWYGLQCTQLTTQVSVHGNLTVFTVLGLNQSTTYCFEVQAWDTFAVHSNRSNPSQGTTLGSGGGGGGGGCAGIACNPNSPINGLTSRLPLNLAIAVGVISISIVLLIAGIRRLPPKPGRR